MSSDHKKHNTPQDERQDSLWQLLENASNKDPSDFFVRNTVREARLQSSASPSLLSRFKALLAPRSISVTTCLGLLVITIIMMWPRGDSTNPAHTSALDSEQGIENFDTTTLNQLIIEESLSAAADDLSIYTRDEIVAMIGF
ncbi:MAG: hypothetical protein ACPIA7_06990 [Akkermansiaceae bacterium]